LSIDESGLDWHDEIYNKEIEEAKKIIFARAQLEYKQAVLEAKKRAIERAKLKYQQLVGVQNSIQTQDFQDVLNKKTEYISAASEYSTVDNLTVESNPINITSNLSSSISTESVLEYPIKTSEQIEIKPKSEKPVLILFDLDNLVLDNYDRKMQTYLEIGWDRESINEFISKKENIYGKIASFNTPTVTFTASSRRNRYYEIYNRPDMLEYDKPYKDVIRALKLLLEVYDIYIISERTEDLKDKTLEVMKKLGFPIDKINIIFKKTHDVLKTYKKNTLQEIVSKYDRGYAVIIHPQDAIIFDTLGITAIGLTIIYEKEEFEGQTEYICDSWNQILPILYRENK